MKREDDCVRVAVRVRPLLGNERLHNCRTCVTTDSNKHISIGNKSFTFDTVFDQISTQQQVYHTSIVPLVEKFCQGYNVTVIAYGQTGSGKTYTMGTSGLLNMDSSDPGIVPRVINEIFENIDGSSTVKTQFMEIHNEEIRDLLNPDTTGEKLFIRESLQGEIVVVGASEKLAHNETELREFLHEGSICRSTGSTMMNSQSSRSHAIFTVILEQHKKLNLGDDSEEDVEAEGNERSDNVEILLSKFHFVDLAGSERLKRTKAQGDRLREGININSGLLALGNVISALGDPKRKGSHVPFRDSKITRILQDSLGGNSQTLMIACISPADENFDETLNTLRYANRAKNIKNKPVVNRDQDSAKILAMQQYIAELEERIRAQNPHGLVTTSFNEKQEMQNLRNQNDILNEEVMRLNKKLNESNLVYSRSREELKSVKAENDLNKLRLLELAQRFSISPEDISVPVEKLNILQAKEEEIGRLQEQLETKTRLTRQLQEDLRNTLRESSLASMRVNNSPLKRVKLDDDDFEDGSDEDECTITSDIEQTSIQLENLQQHHDDVVREYHLQKVNLDHQIRMIDVDMKDKEGLIEELVRTRMQAKLLKENYECKIVDMEHETEVVQKQRDSVLDQLKVAEEEQQGLLVAAKRDYEKKLKDLNKQLRDYRTKLKESTRIAKIKEKDNALIHRLKDEVEGMKNQKTNIQKKMKEEAVNHREWSKELQNQIKRLNKQQRQDKIALQRLQSKFQQREKVLKMKSHENVVLQRRLKNQSRIKESEDRRRHQLQPKILRAHIKNEVLTRAKKIELHQQLSQLWNHREQLIEQRSALSRDLEAAKREEDSSESILDLEDQIESVTDEIQYLEGRIKEFESELDVRTAQISPRMSKKLYKFDMRFFHDMPLSNADELKDVVIFLMNQLLLAFHMLSSQSTKITDLHSGLKTAESQMKEQHILHKVSESEFRRKAEKKQSQIIRNYEKTFQQILEPEVDSQNNSEESNGSQKSSLPRYMDPMSYTESWKAKLASVNKKDKISNRPEKRQRTDNVEYTPAVYKRLADPNMYTGTMKYGALNIMTGTMEDRPRRVIVRSPKSQERRETSLTGTKRKNCDKENEQDCEGASDLCVL